MNETPVNYDDRSDPDCPKTAGDAVVNAVCFTGCLAVSLEQPHNIFCWDANAAVQIEARLAQMGWEVKRTRPWKDDPHQSR